MKKTAGALLWHSQAGSNALANRAGVCPTTGGVHVPVDHVCIGGYIMSP